MYAPDRWMYRLNMEMWRDVDETVSNRATVFLHLANLLPACDISPRHPVEILAHFWQSHKVKQSSMNRATIS